MLNRPTETAKGLQKNPSYAKIVPYSYTKVVFWLVCYVYFLQRRIRCIICFYWFYSATEILGYISTNLGYIYEIVHQAEITYMTGKCPKRSRGFS